MAEKVCPLPRRPLAFVSIVLTAISAPAAEIPVLFDPGSPTARFAAAEIETALSLRGHEMTVRTLEAIDESPSTMRVILASTNDTAAAEAFRNAGGASFVGLHPEGFHLQRIGEAIWILGNGAGGAMYGGLELAEQIRLKGLAGVRSTTQNPHFPIRGTKFNIPLDLRTPSYSDMGDSAQENIPTVWDMTFWEAYLDGLARHRYNLVSIWNLHPFPSLVRTPGYEEIALDDVWRSTIEFDELYSTRTTDFLNDDMLAQVEVVRRLTIDEKIDFWRRVMEYGRDRNIKFYVMTWNLFTYGTDGKYGITDAIDNPVTIDYFRKSVAALFRTYPLLRGIGVTAGENLGDHNAHFQEKEDWLFATYGLGVLDAAREHPDREFRFIHRQHEARASDIAATFQELVEHPHIDFVFSFKYAEAHVKSSTMQPFHHGFVETLGDLKTLWTMRNDDAYLLRWGAPDFVRELIENVPYDVSQGFYYGSDQWIWGRDFLSLDTDERELEIDKHWYHWLIWGRLGYDPAVTNERFKSILAERFPGADAGTLFQAWQDASMVYPLTTGFHWGRFDFQWYIEACFSRPGPAQTESGFHDVNRFITLGTHPGTDNISIPEYLEAMQSGKPIEGTTPPEVAGRLDERSASALELLQSLNSGQDRDLERTLVDIRAMAFLGRYYASKIRGATELAAFRATGNTDRQEAAVHELSEAARHWGDYTSIVQSHYRSPIWFNRVGIVDWDLLRREVARDIEIARNAVPD